MIIYIFSLIFVDQKNNKKYIFVDQKKYIYLTMIRFSLEINFCHLKRVLSTFVFNGLLLIIYLLL